MEAIATGIDRDGRFMRLAARLGERALGTTAENPPVGCVIAAADRILGVGWTAPGGRPHAETQALAMAGEAARGASAYVTLEPCAHHGRTGPCAEALIRAGIARVVTAFTDTDPRVLGRGHERLRAAGVEVRTGLGRAEAWAALGGFLTRASKNRPQVILKMALSADGRIAAAPGRRTRISGDAAQARVHLLRAQCDGILVGLSTVLIDDPELTCRLPGLEARSPVRIVADSRLSLPPQAKLMATRDRAPLWVLSTRRGELGDGIRVIACKAASDGWVDFSDALARLAELGVNRLLVEGGAHTARSLLERGLVDQLTVFRSPLSLGTNGLDAFAGLSWPEVVRGLTPVREERVGVDTLTVYEAHDFREFACSLAS
jgi:diaminohydroxyphosphoribosylaminopyrimidine deaminase / 5-amino-6-(5-phosphoribosylamino)uracil reductase